MDDLKALWRDWTSMPYPTGQYPPGSDEGDVDGVDLALVDGDAAKILWGHFVAGRIDDEARAMLPHALECLERAAPLLEPPGREYFDVALRLLRGRQPGGGSTRQRRVTFANASRHHPD